MAYLWRKRSFHFWLQHLKALSFENWFVSLSYQFRSLGIGGKSSGSWWYCSHIRFGAFAMYLKIQDPHCVDTWLRGFDASTKTKQLKDSKWEKRGYGDCRSWSYQKCFNNGPSPEIRRITFSGNKSNDIKECVTKKKTVGHGRVGKIYVLEQLQLRNMSLNASMQIMQQLEMIESFNNSKSWN